MLDEVGPVSRNTRIQRLDEGFRWPGGRHVALVFNVAYEAWSDGIAPGVGPMGNPLPPRILDTNAISWGHYGSIRGIQRLLRILDRAQIRASVMVSGILATRTPEILAVMRTAGHEIVGHSLAQEIVPAALSAAEEVENVGRTTALLAGAAGARPVGWISPRGTPSPDTSRHLFDAGYLWHGDVFDDDRPYLEIFDTGRLVGIPLTMEINDLPHAMRFGRSPRQFVEAFDDQLDYALQAESAALVIDVTAHAHVYGRPAGAAAFEAIARKARTRDDVWIATREEIARHVLNSVGAPRP
jgi:peptidoglycan/xylan/chitin deacetylase (PgdA/CDA1 family)